ncbi:hypothetical protein FLL45_09465 [Aliikangiella marina]|uniref:Uncharacterized protein n=1 Tax=Aliikangiella marina TaxID=1712262 RepID=A0A545TDA1_9GAMM|nr:hypothetical protein [Aliikangiella marina]TQV75156.1 hypothetical protein FLL45_09465 [Aliikangiella marina]
MIDKNSIAETLKEVLPPGAEVEFDFQGDDFVASFCWLLNNDPKRPFKRSKRVEFVVSPEALEDFSNVGNKKEARLQMNLEMYLNHMLDEFEPDHQAPEGFAEPTEKWRIDSMYFLETLESIPGIKRRLF